MKRIDATLPTLGTVAVDFYSEAEDVLDAMGSRELERLRRVPHLGVASVVFTGVNHSRLEYMLLQCAIISLVAKLHRNNEELALAGRVSINGVSGAVSSGETLLKVWALLSNFGHSQFTYGVERTILQSAIDQKRVADWLTSSTRLPDLNRWCREAITDYSDEKVHFLLALLKVSQFPAHDRRKTKFAHYLRNLLLSEAALFPNDPTSRYKLARLRRLYRRIRLLSMVTLDSYYSHHPIRVDLNAAVLSLGQMSTAGGSPGFESVVRETAGWLADELYLHPRVVAVQRAYEIAKADRFLRQFDRNARSGDRRKYFTGTFMWNGFGRPKLNILRHVVRLTFDEPRQQLLGRSNLYETLQYLERDLTTPPTTRLSVDRNRFSGSVHIDVLASLDDATIGDLARVYTRLQKWLFRSMEAAALQHVRSLFHRAGIPEDRVREFASTEMRARFPREMRTLKRILDSLISELIPEGKTAGVSEFVPGPGDHAVLAKIEDLAGAPFDQITPALELQLVENPRQLARDRLHELHALKRIFGRSRAPFTLVCLEKFVIRDEHDRVIDDWDGTMIEFSDREIVLTVIEAKNKGGKVAAANEAFKQLAITRDLVCNRHGLNYRRVRMSGLGARLRVIMPVPDSPLGQADR